MKNLWLVIILALPCFSQADHLDVIEVQLNPDCDFNTYLAITKDFNEKWAKDYNYRAEVLMPLQSHTLDSLFWVGRSANAAAFGKAWDAWRNELGNEKSVAAKLWARFEQCSSNVARRSYDAY
ncbi:MAG: hypothetical protein HKO71_04255 [Pseudomonadales bacterium]|nr:hypothetical protein [Gammaproteobacteria bacterium]NNL56939.1 hypothetical protein [Pseudomonadales bacterium]